MFKTIKDQLDSEHSGAVAFEYIIILVIMAVAIFGTWQTYLGPALTNKGKEVSDFIKNNGQSGLGTGGSTPTTP